MLFGYKIRNNKTNEIFAKSLISIATRIYSYLIIFFISLVLGSMVDIKLHEQFLTINMTAIIITSTILIILAELLRNNGFKILDEIYTQQSTEKNK